MKFIVFDNNQEILVTTVEYEYILLKEWFTEGDRNHEDYERTECEDVVQIKTAFKIRD